MITVENLSKQFRIGNAPMLGGSLRDALHDGIRGLASRFRAGRAAAGKTQEFWALRDLSFTVSRGDIVGIVGRNGAGKSTLLKILSRITPPTRGRVTLQGRVASLLEVGTGFHGELTGRENIFLNGAILGMSRAEIRARFDEIVAFAELDRFVDTPVKRYSSGMYVRLAFAVAAHLEPDILIVDEVLAVGDLEFQRKCLGRLEQATRKEGRTVLFVSHNLASVRQLCTRALLLDRGSLLMDASPAEVVAAYTAAAGTKSHGNRAYKHIRGNGVVTIENVAFGDAVGEANHEPSIAVFDRMMISLHYRVRAEEVKPTSLEFFVLLHSEDGECVVSMFQGDSGSILRSPSGGGRITLTFTNPLAPGRYFVSAGIFDSGRQFLDWVEHAESFHVEAAFANGRSHDQRLGRMSLLAEWSEGGRE